MNPVPVVTVWVAGAFTAAMLAALVAWLLTFINPPFIIWIKQINTCRGTEFGAEEGVAAQLLALALSFADTPSAVSGMVSTTNTLQSILMRKWRVDKKIITKPRIHSRNAACATTAQNGIVETAAFEALKGDGTAMVLVDMLQERGLLQYSAAGECYVTGEVVVYVMGILKMLGYDAYVDAGSITNSWMHLVMSDPELVRLGVEIELELHVDSTTST